MQQSDFKIIDIKKEFAAYNNLWENCIEYLKINCYRDQLYQNYTDIDLDKFLTFTAVIYQDEIISFGGVERQVNRWGRYIARALTKFWIDPKYRTLGLTKWRSNSIKFSPIVLRPQLEFLKTLPKIEAVIITREGNYLKSFQEIIRLANTVSEREFTIMPGRYNVCECMESPPDSCKQFVAIDDFNSFKSAQRQGYFRQYE